MADLRRIISAASAILNDAAAVLSEGASDYNRMVRPIRAYAVQNGAVDSASASFEVPPSATPVAPPGQGGAQAVVNGAPSDGSAAGAPVHLQNFTLSASDTSDVGP